MRLATVKATGRRYVVLRLHFPTNGAPARVYCRGAVVGLCRGRPTHERPVVFDRAEVELTEEHETAALLRSLVREWADAQREAGLDVELVAWGDSVRASIAA